MLTMGQRNEWMAVQSGRVHMFMIRHNEIEIEDIALALSNINRFLGHTRPGYSVAQHCVDGTMLLRMEGADIETQFAFLLHDAGEAYSGDWPSPIKRWLPSARRLCYLTQRPIYRGYMGIDDLDAMMRATIQAMDMQMLSMEARHLFRNWREWGCLRGVTPPADWEKWRGPIPAEQAEQEYLERFAAIQAEWEGERG